MGLTELPNSGGGASGPPAPSSYTSERGTSMLGTVRKQKLVKFGYSFGVYFKAWILFKSKIQQLIRYQNTIFARKYRQIQRSRSAKVL